MAHNWLNDTARNLNGKIFERRLKTSRFKDVERKKNIKAKSLTQTIKEETIFIRGKYTGMSIGTVLDIDPTYCCWVLENQPKGIVAQQIINHFNKQEYHANKDQPGKITGSYTTPTHNFDGSPVDFTQPPF